VTITYTPAGGGDPEVHEVATYGDDGGVAMGMFNFTDSIRDFARASLNYGLQRGLPVYLSTKNTILRRTRSSRPTTAPSRTSSKRSSRPSSRRRSTRRG